MLQILTPDFSVVSLGDGRLKVTAGESEVLIPTKSVETFQRSVKLAADDAEECVWPTEPTAS